MIKPQLLLAVVLFVAATPRTTAAQATGGIVDEIISHPSAGGDITVSAFSAATYPLVGEMQEAETFRRHFAGSSLFILANLLSLSDPPVFYQLNYGYRLTPKDAISIEAITWRYHAPLGIPYGSWGSPDEAYPGHITEYGVGAAYQRFLWKGAYSAIHALPLLQNYVNAEQEIIQRGFQLFLTFRLGYHVKLFQNRFFLEPNIAFTHWPVNTNVPETFADLEAKWPNYFLFEPGLHFGVAF